MKFSNVKRAYNISRKCIAQRVKIRRTYFALLNCLNRQGQRAMQFAAFVLKLFDKVEKLDSARDTYGGSRYLSRRPTGCELIPTFQKVE